MASLVCKVIGMWLSYLGLDVDETWCCREKSGWWAGAGNLGTNMSRARTQTVTHAFSYESNPTAQSYILQTRLLRCGMFFWIPFPKVKSDRDVTDVLCRKNISLFYFILLESPRARGLGMSSCHGWCVRGFGFPLTFDQGVDASPCARRVSWKVANCVQPQRWMQEDAQDFKLGSQTIWVYVTWLYNVIHRFV